MGRQLPLTIQPRIKHASALIPREKANDLLVLIGGESRFAIEILSVRKVNHIHQLFSFSDIQNPHLGPQSLLDITAIAVRGLILVAGGGQKVFQTQLEVEFLYSIPACVSALVEPIKLTVDL
jgi:hypothetical protein